MPEQQSIAEINRRATAAIDVTRAILSARGVEQNSQIPASVFDTVVSEAGKRREDGDFLGCAVLLTNIGVTIDRIGDGK